jgi:2,3-bisphosphoglycerate-dependent phosphoglycerate mutase
MAALILLRHGQSIWNLENRFTGTVDVDLSMQGELEASRAAAMLKSYTIDIAYSSVLKRAIHTLEIILNENNLSIPVVQDSSLNERDYGDLQGLDKAEAAQRFGNDQVQLWRRGYDVTPPNGESLKETFNRVLPYYHTEIEPELMTGKTVLIVAHGNSLRALMMYLEGISAKEIEDVNIATCVPRIYFFNEAFEVEKVVDLIL